MTLKWPQTILKLLSLACLATVAQAQQAALAGYTPHAERCPPDFHLIRQAGKPGEQSLSPKESLYIDQRNSRVLPSAWKDYFASVNATGTLPAYVGDILGVSSHNRSTSLSGFPTIGVALSGGGYRAAIFGAGVLNALDGRNASARQVGTGGLLQTSTYLSALSGGAWFLTSLVQSNFPIMQDVIFGSPSSDGNEYSGWHADTHLLPNSTEFDREIIAEVTGKHAAGFLVSVGDLWARALARHFVNGTTTSNINSTTDAHGAGILFSQIAELPVYQNHQAPLPIVLGNVISSNGTALELSLANEIYEFNLYEMGSFDPTLSAFAPIKYLGSTNSSVCITNFDQTSLVSAISSNVFPFFNTSDADFNSSIIGELAMGLGAAIPQSNTIRLDSALVPNPFRGLHPGRYANSNESILSLIDGGSDQEGIPLQPLLVKARDVDAIVAIDADGDTSDGYAAGSSLIATQSRAKLYPSSYSFPSVPNDTSTFISQNLAARPTFFGCSDTSSPLVIYLANGAAPPGQPNITNIIGLDPNLTNGQIQAALDQTFVIATQGRPAVDSGEQVDREWAACLACAVVDRKRQARGFAREGVCASCFERYCYERET